MVWPEVLGHVHFEKEAPQIQHLRTAYRRCNVTDGYIALCHTIGGIFATSLLCGAVSRSRLVYMMIVSRRAILCAITHTLESLYRLLTTEDEVFLFLVAESDVLTTFRQPCFVTSPNIFCEHHFGRATPLLYPRSSFNDSMVPK